MEIDKSFKNWNAQEVEKEFGISRIRKSSMLDAWLSATPPATEYQLISVEHLRSSAENDIDAWNEPALKFFFIGPLITLVDFNEDEYHGFLERTLTIENERVTAKGNIDFMVAAGRQTPEAPYYLLHEYKPETTTVLDPQGQLLIAMLAAKISNIERGLTIPIYGSYVIGRIWFFVILEGDEYIISRAYDCTQPDGVRSIFYALLEVKRYVSNLHQEALV